MLPGKHNLENVLASVAVAWIMDIDFKIVRDVLKTFPGVEHRIEYVDTINGGLNFIMTPREQIQMLVLKP